MLRVKTQPHLAYMADALQRAFKFHYLLEYEYKKSHKFIKRDILRRIISRVAFKLREHDKVELSQTMLRIALDTHNNTIRENELLSSARLDWCPVQYAEEVNTMLDGIGDDIYYWIETKASSLGMRVPRHSKPMARLIEQMDGRYTIKILERVIMAALVSVAMDCETTVSAVSRQLKLSRNTVYHYLGMCYDARSSSTG